MENQYDVWIKDSSFSFCKYPWILDPRSKQKILNHEAELEMKHEQMRVMQNNPLMFFSPFLPGLVVGVRREFIRQDTLSVINQVMASNPQVLKRPLKVHFVGEEGIDEGGVRKEYFMLIIPELIKEDFGMFVLNPVSRTFWFNTNSFEIEEFQLIGIVLGWGIFNGVNLDVHFPLVVYKKLLGQPVSWVDLKGFDDELYHSFLKLLEFNGDVEQTFCLDFSINHDFYGEMKTIELKENGTSIPVTNDNRVEYVELYSKYLLIDSVAVQVQYSFCKINL